MATKLLFADDARNALLSGVDQVARAVRLTLGPTGRNVALGKRSGPTEILAQGQNILQDVELPDPFENLGVDLIKQLARQTDERCGDGTTTATVLAHAMLCEGVKNIVAGANAMILKHGMERAVGVAAASIRELARPLDMPSIRHVLASASGDPEIAEALIWGVEQVGANGMMLVERFPKSLGIVVECVDGFQYDRGYLSSYFCGDAGTEEITLDEPYLLLTDAELTRFEELLPLLEQLRHLPQSSLVVIAPEVQDSALGLLLTNNQRGVLRSVAVRPPSYGDYRAEMLRDLALYTGGKIISKTSGLRVQDVRLADLGRAEVAQVSANTTTIAGGRGSEAAIEARITELRARLEAVTDPNDREKLDRRIAQLGGGLARVRVGGASEAEMEYRINRVENALTSLRAAEAEGIVPGGGAALARAAEALAGLELTGDEAAGVRVVRRALEEPLRQIATNAGEDASVVLDTIHHLQRASGQTFVGYDARRRDYCDLLERGIVDPCKTVCTALTHAASCAAMILSTEAVIVGTRLKIPALPDEA